MVVKIESISGIANIPKARGIGFIPSYKSHDPKVNLCSPVKTEEPTVPRTSPRNTAQIPLKEFFYVKDLQKLIQENIT